MNNLNKDIKVFFIDLDGTTLDTKKGLHHWVSEENLRMIQETRRQNKYVIISTGRLGQGVKPYQNLIGGEYTIAANGAIIYDANHKIIWERKMSIQQCHKITEILRRNKISLKVDDKFIAFGVTTLFGKMIAKKFGFKPKSSYNYGMQSEHHRMLIWGKSKSKMREIQRLLLENVNDLSVVSSANGWTLEITHKEGTKGSADLYVAQELLGIKNINQIAHIGDTMNDSTAIGKVGRFIAMGNADKSLMKLVKFVGPKYKRAGVAKILKGEYKEK